MAYDVLGRLKDQEIESLVLDKGTCYNPHFCYTLKLETGQTVGNSQKSENRKT